MENPFNHTEYDAWPDERIQARLFELINLAAIPHGEERTAQITHERDYLIFEAARRLIDAATEPKQLEASK